MLLFSVRLGDHSSTLFTKFHIIFYTRSKYLGQTDRQKNGFVFHKTLKSACVKRMCETHVFEPICRYQGGRVHNGMRAYPTVVLPQLP